MRFDVRPLSDALGAEIIGLDLDRALDAETFRAVRQAHLDHLVVGFRDQELSPEAQIAFSKRLGDPAYIRHMHRTTVMGDRPY